MMMVSTIAALVLRGPAMKNLLLPSWEPTYNLTRSTMTQLCFGPGMGGAPELTPKTGAFLKARARRPPNAISDPSLCAGLPSLGSLAT